MTRKLYDENPRLLQFTGKVLSCTFIEKKKLYEVILDQTAFFPEEGGQMPDKGTLNGQTVVDVRLKKESTDTTYTETILHHMKEPMEVGAKVEGIIDWAHRFDQMQQHSGEHIVSGLMHQRFGCDNVGFHLGPEEVTLDFNTVVGMDTMREIETLANEAIHKNFQVMVEWPSKEELAAMEYRSKIELKGPVRIVTFPGYDKCACCAPHVERTGEIGLIKVTNVQNHRGGIRVNILCGNRALADYSQKQDSVREISVGLAIKQEKVADGVVRLKNEMANMREQLNRLQTELVQVRLSKLPDPTTQKNVMLVMEELDPVAARNAANQMVETYEGYAIVLVGTEEKGYRMIIGTKSGDCKAMSNELRKAFPAKGGGSKEMIQGTLTGTSPESLLDWINQYEG